MRFADFVIYDDAARAIYCDCQSQRRCRDYLARLSEAARDVRKGVAFKQKSLDDVEHGVFAQRLAQGLWQKPRTNDTYGNFLHQSVLRQGDILGGMQWDKWEVTKKALELGGIDPNAITDSAKTPAERLAIANRINWANITLPALKTKLGPSFKVDNAWKRVLGIERLKRIKAAMEQGQPITDPQERRLLGIWRTLEVQLGGNIVPSGPTTDVPPTRLPMSPHDRRRFYKALTGTNESVAPTRTALRLSPQSAYDNLLKYGVEVVSDEEAKDLYLTRILQDLQNKEAFIPASAKGSQADRKRWRDSVARSWGGFLPAARSFDPANAPGVAQRLSGMTTKGFKTRTNPSGRRVPSNYPEPEDFQWPSGSEDMPGIKYSMDVPSLEVPNEDINAFYRSGTPEANAAVQQELEKPARDAVHWLKRQGWIHDATKIDDYVQQIVMGMLARTGAVANWRDNVGFRRTTASMLARRYASQGWPSQTKERSGHTGHREGDQPGVVQTATSSNRRGGEDAFSRVRGSAAKAREAIQKAIASVLDTDTSGMGRDEEAFVDALDSLRDPDKALEALDVLDDLSARYERVLPQVRRAVDRIKRNLEPLVRKVRAGR